MPFTNSRGSTRGSQGGYNYGSRNNGPGGSGTFRGGRGMGPRRDNRLGSSGSVADGSSNSARTCSRDRDRPTTELLSRPIYGGSGGSLSRNNDGQIGSTGNKDSGRTVSNSWGRLKPVNTDPLDEFGLPSKGDTRLLDLKTQERYYTKIVGRYMSFCSKAGQRDELLRRFAALNLRDSNNDQDHMNGSETPTFVPLGPPVTNSHSTASATAPDGTQFPQLQPIVSPNTNKDLSMVISALRKLREGIVASKRADNFAVQVYLFCIRLCVLVQHPEGYQPAALHLLRRIHPLSSLTSLELAEVASYLVLDAACRRTQLAEAYSIRKEYRLDDPKVNVLLRALAQDNYILFRKVKNSVDGHKARIMDFAEKDVCSHMLKCFGRAYFTIDKTSLETFSGLQWDTLIKEHGVGWELEDQTVVIRRIRQQHT
ncbi:hypothetical protein BROUX41_005697 [Berkeleyomyces rouxiae]|uniref:uncharacterized protein n=1 Tax=Berkeleyomyces rouxiae TaxID=2035830 RepID=UPI003B78A077